MWPVLVPLGITVAIGILARRLRDLPPSVPEKRPDRERFSDTGTTQETILWIGAAVVTILILGVLVWKLRQPKEDEYAVLESFATFGSGGGSEELEFDSCKQDLDCTVECKADEHCNVLGVEGLVCNTERGECQFPDGKTMSTLFRGKPDLMCHRGQCVLKAEADRYTSFDAALAVAVADASPAPSGETAI